MSSTEKVQVRSKVACPLPPEAAATEHAASRQSTNVIPASLIAIVAVRLPEARVRKTHDRAEAQAPAPRGRREGDPRRGPRPPWRAPDKRGDGRRDHGRDDAVPEV